MFRGMSLAKVFHEVWLVRFCLFVSQSLFLVKVWQCLSQTGWPSLTDRYTRWQEFGLSAGNNPPLHEWQCEIFNVHQWPMQANGSSTSTSMRGMASTLMPHPCMWNSRMSLQLGQDSNKGKTAKRKVRIPLGYPAGPGILNKVINVYLSLQHVL